MIEIVDISKGITEDLIQDSRYFIVLEDKKVVCKTIKYPRLATEKWLKDRPLLVYEDGKKIPEPIIKEIGLEYDLNKYLERFNNEFETTQREVYQIPNELITNDDIMNYLGEIKAIILP